MGVPPSEFVIRSYLGLNALPTIRAFSLRVINSGIEYLPSGVVFSLLGRLP
jgi:hypothetical protein